MGGSMLIRKIALMLAMGIALLTFWSPIGFCADVAKIGTVNFQKIFTNSTAGKAAKDKINSEGQRMNADLEKVQNEIKELQDLLGKDSDSGLMNEAARESKKWELDRKIAEVKALKKRFDRKIQELQRQLINQVRKDVFEIINEHGKKEGYLMIIEDLSVVYAPKSLDVTDKIIQLYNAQYAKSSKN